MRVDSRELPLSAIPLCQLLPCHLGPPRPTLSFNLYVKGCLDCTFGAFQVVRWTWLWQRLAAWHCRSFILFSHRYIRTVALQIEVTKFLQTCLTSGAGEAASVATAYVDSSKLPTLFTNSQAKTDLAIMVRHNILRGSCQFLAKECAQYWLTT